MVIWYIYRIIFGIPKSNNQNNTEFGYGLTVDEACWSTVPHPLIQRGPDTACKILLNPRGNLLTCPRGILVDIWSQVKEHSTWTFPRRINYLNPH